MGVSGNPKGSSAKAKANADPGQRGYREARKAGKEATAEQKAANARRVQKQRDLKKNK